MYNMYLYIWYLYSVYLLRNPWIHFYFLHKNNYSWAMHLHHGWCRRHRHSGIRHLSPIPEDPIPDWVPLFRYQTGSGIGILFHSGTGMTGCRCIVQRRKGTHPARPHCWRARGINLTSTLKTVHGKDLFGTWLGTIRITWGKSPEWLYRNLRFSKRATVGVLATYATRWNSGMKRVKCGWTQPIFHKVSNHWFSSRNLKG